MDEFGQFSSRFVRVRRDHLYLDAFTALAHTHGRQLKTRLRFSLVSHHGHEEAGIDGGGPLRETLTGLTQAAFDVRNGLWVSTREGYIYPNPRALLASKNALKHYEFCGRLLSLCLYHGLLHEVPLAPFLQVQLMSHRPSLSDLRDLDADLHRNLTALAKYKGDCSELDLDFTIAKSRPFMFLPKPGMLDPEAGEEEIPEAGEEEVPEASEEVPEAGLVDPEAGESPTIVELVPGGKSIAVNNANRVSYVYLVANYRLNVELRPQIAALRTGLTSVIEPSWFKLFFPREFRTLMSGSEDTRIDIHDMRAAFKYSGGFSESHPTVQLFWIVMEELSQKQIRSFLKFVTGCSRPPFFGLRDLNPAPCLQCASRDLSSLPSASTCMNLFKMPAYPDIETLREKLLLAIENAEGFELS